MDSNLLTQATAGSRVRHVLDLLADDQIEAHFYADTGPGKSATRVYNPPNGVSAVQDWVEVRPGKRDDRFAVSWIRNGTPNEKEVLKDRFSYRRILEAPLPTAYRTLADPEERREADALAMLAAYAIRADLFITTRQGPLELGHDPESTTTALSPEDALPVLGLYLRQQGRFVVNPTPMLGERNLGKPSSQPSKSDFYWHAAELLLPQFWRWKRIIRQTPSPTNDELDVLLRALLWRVDQALQARDRLLAAYSVPQDPETADEVPTELDHILLWLMAAFDITARVAHTVYSLDPTQISSAGWQDDKWLKKVEVHDCTLTALVKGNSEGKRLLAVLTSMRNSIHGAALSGSVVQPIVGDQAGATLLRLPHQGRNKVLPAIAGLGGQKRWGITTTSIDPKLDLYIRPGEFVEQLVPLAIRVIDQLMTALDVERLIGAGNTKRMSTTLPQTNSDQRTLWQLALND